MSSQFVIPATDPGVPVPLADAPRQVQTAVQRNDASVMDHLAVKNEVSANYDTNERSSHLNKLLTRIVAAEDAALAILVVSQSIYQLRRRLFPPHGGLDKLFHSGSTLENPGASRTGTKMLEHILVRFN